MVPNRFALVLVAASCVSAAGAGSYIATRQSLAAAAPATALTEPAPVGDTPTPTTARPTAPVASARLAPTVALPTRPVAAKANIRAAATERPATRVAPPVERREPAEYSATPEPVEHVATAHEPSTVEPPLMANAVPMASMPDTPEPEPAPTAATARTFEELRIAADAVIGLQSETSVNSERAKVEDRVEARVIRDVMVDGVVAIPAGSRVIGSVTIVERGGKFRERARLGIRFNTLVLGDGERVAISTDTIYRYGDSPSDKSAAKIGGATAAGAILGAIIGGSKGAAIGATTGAGAGTAAVMAIKAGAATFPAGVEVTARLTSPVSVTVERE